MNGNPHQDVVDTEHLRILSICYYVFAGLNALFSLFGLFYAGMGLVIGGMIAHTPDRNAPPPALIGMLFGAFGLVFFSIFVCQAVLQFLAGRRLRERRSRVFCMVVAALACFVVPFGTALGVFTLVVLSRDSVRRSFEPPPAP